MKIKRFIQIFFCTLMIGSAAPCFSQPITINYEGVDIQTLISTVSELTGKNFVVDPRVKGKITVISAKPLTIKEVYQVFLSVLEVHGYSAVPSGTVVKIVPSNKAKQDTIPTGNASSGNQMVTRVVQVKNVSAGQLTPILRPLMPQHGHLAAYNATNTLIITDRADNVRRLLKIIRRIDQVSDAEVDIVRLRHASAAEIVRILTKLQQSAIAKGKSRRHTVRLAADERTNSVLLSGERSARVRMRAIITHMDTPLESGGNTQVIYLRYVKAKDMVPILTGVSKSIDKKKTTGRKVSKPTMPINIQADEANNALVITAPPDILRSLKQVVGRLDIRRAQVLVEAIIAEVSTDKARELGVQWMLAGQKDNKGAGAVTNFTNSNNGSIGSVANSLNQGQVPILGDGLNLLLGRLGNDRFNVGVLINALKSDSNTNILSTPSILTLDNQKAEIVVGQNVPFLTGVYSNTGSGNNGTVNPFQTIQRQDVGLTLRVKPQINEGNSIMLEIDQEVSSINPTARASDIITNKRTIKTTVMVENGQTIVLGGLIDNQVTQSKRKVPILGSIPLLGKLFQYKSASRGKQNLMVFLRPIILSDKRTQSLVTGSKYSYMIERQKQMNKDHKVHGPVMNKDIRKITPVPPEVLLQQYRKQLEGKGSSKPGASTTRPSATQKGRREPVTHVPADNRIGTSATIKSQSNARNNTEHNYNN